MNHKKPLNLIFFIPCLFLINCAPHTVKPDINGVSEGQNTKIADSTEPVDAISEDSEREAAETEPGDEISDRPLDLIIDSEGVLWMNKEKVSLDDLKTLIPPIRIEAESRGASLRAIIYADGKIAHEKVVRLIDTIKVLGIDHFSIKVKPIDEEKCGNKDKILEDETSDQISSSPDEEKSPEKPENEIPAEKPGESEDKEDNAPEEAAVEEENPSFENWMKAFRKRAARAGISEEALSSLDGISPIPRVIELDRRQPERRLTFRQYLARVVPESRVQDGRKRYLEHKEILEEIGEKYGVSPRFLVALWGIETDYGRNTGGFRVLDSLATLAHEGRRAAFFERELINALKIIDEGHISADEMMGSWAGALGQCQFMPSSFMSYAVDHTGDGKKDIWGSLPDVFASSANYLSRHGWQAGQTWGRQVKLPENFDQSLTGLDTRHPIEHWQNLGVRRPDGTDLPVADFESSIVQPGGKGGPAYLVYNNYRTIMLWNRSLYFATAVGLLADRIGAP